MSRALHCSDNSVMVACSLAVVACGERGRGERRQRRSGATQPSALHHAAAHLMRRLQAPHTLFPRLSCLLRLLLCGCR